VQPESGRAYFDLGKVGRAGMGQSLCQADGNPQFKSIAQPNDNASAAAFVSHGTCPRHVLQVFLKFPFGSQNLSVCQFHGSFPTRCNWIAASQLGPTT
jgi:hypothetical protein